MIDRIPVWLPALLFSVVAVAPTLGGWCSLTPDSFDYLATARTLFESGSFPETHMMRPPGFPVLIAPLFLFGDPPLYAIRLLFAICFIATAGLSAVLTMPMLGRRSAVLVGLLVSMNGPILIQATTCLSEMVFLPIELGVLILIDRMSRSVSPSWWMNAMCGALAGVAVMVRTIGAALVPVGALVIIMNRKLSKRDRLISMAVFLATASSMPAAWHFRQSGYQGQEGYGRMWFQARAAEQTDATGLVLQGERLVRFGGERLADLKRAVIPNQILWRAFQSPWSGPTTVAIAVLVIAAAVYRVVRHRSPAEAYLLVVLGVLLLWPWEEGVRLLVPLTPIVLALLVLLGTTLLHFVSWRQPWSGRIAAAAILLLFMAEWSHVVASMPAIAEKSRRRMREAGQFASELAVLLPESREVVCVCRNGDNLKLTFLGGQYLSRRKSVRVVEFEPNQSESGVFSGNYYAVIADNLNVRHRITQGATTKPAGAAYSIVSPKDTNEH